MNKKIFTETILYLAILITPISMILMIASGKIYDGRNKYGDAAFIVGLIGTVPFIVAMLILVVRYIKVVERYGEWLQRNALLYFFVIVPTIIFVLFIVQRELR